ncbi:hypothetical protein ILUMI_02936 [Ignelater luminosus]|uniref:Barrier-to-autointegration factor-like protein n=1 Tax=Ignelater luminosus TaxID=2038154 RepID=A0A8K0DMU1_IGNLU|nr:hypothetical protein ILUMI_02936 [Ignelater luminosus]
MSRLNNNLEYQNSEQIDLPQDMIPICPNHEEKQNSNVSYYSCFTSEPIGNKPVTKLAGIGEILGKRLQEAGFDQAYVVLGQYLLLKRNKELFEEWMKDICKANSKQASDCYRCINEWCEEFLF